MNAFELNKTNNAKCSAYNYKYNIVFDKATKGQTDNIFNQKMAKISKLLNVSELLPPLRGSSLDLRCF